MYQFPNEDLLPRSEDGSVPIRGGSVGMNVILGLFKEKSTVDRVPAWTCFLLNGYTLFSGIYDENLSDTDLQNGVVKDIELFSLYLDAYLSRFRQVGRIPVIIYFPTYDKIPKDVLRVPSKKIQTMNARYKMFLRRVPRDEGVLSQSDMSVRIAVQVGKLDLPHIELAKWLREFFLREKRSVYKWNDPVFLMTHCPIDLHIYRRVPNIELVERFTGAIKPPSTFGTKLTKDVAVPFIVATHRAFGDAVHIEPIAKRNVKKKLIEVAGFHKWMIRTPASIIADICKVTQVKASDLNSVRM